MVTCLEYIVSWVLAGGDVEKHAAVCRTRTRNAIRAAQSKGNLLLNPWHFRATPFANQWRRKTIPESEYDP